MSDLPDKYDHALMTLWWLFKDYQKLQAQVDELEAALKEIIDTDYAEPVAPVAMKEIARAALQENE